MAIFPMQDVLGLGSEARMNRPATLGDNWIWRVTRSGLESQWTERLRRMSETYGRVPEENALQS
jgi:4-alpha-glucanotransferase